MKKRFHYFLPFFFFWLMARDVQIKWIFIYPILDAALALMIQEDRKHSWKIPFASSARPCFGVWLSTVSQKQVTAFSLTWYIFTTDLQHSLCFRSTLPQYSRLLSTSNYFGIQTHGICTHISAWTLCRIPEHWAFSMQGRIMADYWAYVVRYSLHLSSDLFRI